MTFLQVLTALRNTRGAWWFRKCYDAHLNGEYLRGSHDRLAHGITWLKFKGDKYSYKTAEMKVGPSII